MNRNAYSSDLTGAPWTLLEPRLPPAKPGGRPRSVDPGEVVDTMRYLLQTGCAWRSLPRDLPPWATVGAYFRGVFA